MSPLFGLLFAIAFTNAAYVKLPGAGGSWASQRDACIAVGMKLAEPKNAEETAAVTLLCGQDNYCWGGLTDQAVEGTWKFASTGLTASYVGFISPEPNNAGTGEHCLEFRDFNPVTQTGAWNDMVCSQVNQAICEGDYYKGTTAKVWSDAQTECQNLGLRLANPRNAAETTTMKSLLGPTWVTDGWVGLNDRDIEGSFIGTDGFPPSYPAFWANGEPNNNGNEDCGEVRFTNGGNDALCTHNRFAICEAGCGTKYAESRGVCLCTSGRSGVNCWTNNLGSCPLTAVPSNTEVVTSTFGTIAVASNALTLTVKSPYRPGRYVESVMVSPTGVSGADADACGYPGYNMVLTGSTANCEDTITATIPYSAISSPTSGCKFSRAQNVVEDGSKFTVLTSDVRVTVVDNVGSLRGVAQTRRSTENYKIKVKLPEGVTATTNVNIHAAIDIQSAIISSVVSGGGVGTIVWRTSVQAPFKLSASIASPMNSFTTSISSVDVTCTTTGVCTQDHTLVLTSTGPANPCQLDGTFTVNLGITCRTTPCPLSGETSSADLVLESSDFCAITSFTTTGLAASLTPYGDSGLVTQKSAFLPNQRMYFKVTVNSPNAPLASVTVSKVQYEKTQSGGPIEIYPTYPLSLNPPDPVTRIASTGSGNTLSASFNFVATVGTGNTFLYNLAADEIKTGLRVWVTADVTYTTGRRRRMLLEADVVETEAPVGLSGPASGAAVAATPEATAATATTTSTALIGAIAGTAAAVVALLLAIVVVGVLYLRRTAPPAAAVEEAAVADAEKEKEFETTEEEENSGSQ